MPVPILVAWRVQNNHVDLEEETFDWMVELPEVAMARSAE